VDCCVDDQVTHDGCWWPRTRGFERRPVALVPSELLNESDCSRQAPHIAFANPDIASDSCCVRARVPNDAKRFRPEPLGCQEVTSKAVTLHRPSGRNRISDAAAKSRKMFAEGDGTARPVAA
jgi:hypothetical protein